VRADVHGLGVEKQAQQGLRAARVLDRLLGEEDVVGGVVVKGPVGELAGVVRRGRDFEEEDDAVDRAGEISNRGVWGGQRT
jgi:hypothetical protein